MGLFTSRGPIAIDPPGCGCTECMTGQYVPLDQATKAQILDLLAGRVADHTGADTEFTVTIDATGYSWAFSATDVLDALRERLRDGAR